LKRADGKEVFSFGRVFNELEVETANDFKFFAGLQHLGWNQWV